MTMRANGERVHAVDGYEEVTGQVRYRGRGNESPWVMCANANYFLLCLLNYGLATVVLQHINDQRRSNPRNELEKLTWLFFGFG